MFIVPASNSMHHLRFQQSLWQYFYSCDLDLWPMNVTQCQVNQPVKYLGQRSFSSEVIVQTHRHTHIPAADCCTWTTKSDL